MTDLYPRHQPLPKGATWERPEPELRDPENDVWMTRRDYKAVEPKQPFSSYQKIAKQAETDAGYWFDQRLADLEHAEEQKKRERSRLWREEAMKAPLPNAAHFKQMSTAAKKTTKAIRELSKNMPKPRVGANLQHRPFLILSVLRDDLTK